MNIIKEDYKKEIQESILLKGLQILIDSNTKTMTSLNTTNMTTLMSEFEKAGGDRGEDQRRFLELPRAEAGR